MMRQLQSLDHIDILQAQKGYGDNEIQLLICRKYSFSEKLWRDIASQSIKKFELDLYILRNLL